MSDSEATRHEWTRRVAAAYDGWPEWLTPGTVPDVLPRAPEGEDSARDAGRGTAADVPIGDITSGWSWGLTQAEVERVDRRLVWEQRTGRTARAVREERTYWGL